VNGESLKYVENKENLFGSTRVEDRLMIHGQQRQLRREKELEMKIQEERALGSVSKHKHTKSGSKRSHFSSNSKQIMRTEASEVGTLT